MNWILRLPLENDRVLQMLQWVAWIWLVALFCFLTGGFLFNRDEREWITPLTEASAIEDVAYEKIGSGPLALSGTGGSPLFTALCHEILILGKNTRPDVRSQDAEISLCLCKSGQRRLVKSGVPVFLDLQVNESCDLQSVQFANGSSPVWITPRALDGESILFEVGECPLFSEIKKRQFIQNITRSNHQKNESPAFSALASSQLLGRDRFFEKYGGETYHPLAQKEKIELSGPESSYALYIQEGDLLSWKEGKWQLGADSSAPIAAVEQIAPGEVVLQAWNETGFETQQIRLLRKRIDPSSIRLEKFLSAVRMRTATQISALLEGKRIILKKGDWLIKSKNNWKTLRSARDIEAYLRHEIRGPLFVFDGIENRGDGNLVLQGHLFDETRTLIEPVILAVNPDRNLQKGKRRHKK